MRCALISLFICNLSWSFSYAQFLFGEIYNPSGFRGSIDEKIDFGITSNIYLGGRINSGHAYVSMGATLDDPGMYALAGVETKQDWLRIFAEVYNSTTTSGRSEAQIFIGLGVIVWQNDILGL